MLSQDVAGLCISISGFIAFSLKKTIPKMDFQSDDGCWVTFAPEHRLFLAVHAGPRNQKSADVIVKQTGERIDEIKLPLFVSDGLKDMAMHY